MEKKKIIALILSAVFLIVVALEFFTALPYYRMSDITYLDLDGNEITARFYQGDKKEGVVIVNDLSRNMKDLSVISSELIKMGYSVFLFDFPSQGDTKGYISYGYKKTAELAEIYYCGVDNFAKMTGISAEDIHVIATGTGARVALQTASLGFFTPKDLTLISINTNLQERIQFDVINYNKDSELSWVNSLNAKQPNNLDIRLIVNNLNESGLKESEFVKEKLSQKNTDKYYENTPSNKTTIEKVNWVIPGYELKSGRVINNVLGYIAEKDRIDYSVNIMVYLNTFLSISMLAILLAVLHIVGDYMDEKYHLEKNPTRYFTREIFISKFLALIPSLLFVFVLPVFLYFTVGSVWAFPYMEVIKVSTISCCGMVLYVLYNKTTFAQDLGDVIFVPEHKHNVKGGIYVFALAIILMVLLSYGGLNYVFPFITIKSLWVILFGGLSMFIYYIDEKEKEVMDLSRWEMLIITGMNFGSIAVVSAFLLIIGKISLAINYFLVVAIIIFTLELGRVLRAINTPTMFSSFIKAMILYIAILSQSVLFF